MWSERLKEITKLVEHGHFKQAVQESGSLLEALLRQLYRQTTDNLPAGDQKALSQTLEKIGKGKPVNQLTLGQLVGLFREANLFEKAEKALERKLKHLGTTNFNTFVDIRNRATHEGEELSEDEAKLFAAQLSVFIAETGYSVGESQTAPQPTSGGSIRPWLEVVTLHPDVLSEDFSEDIFALDLGPLADGNPNVAAVYRDRRP